MATFWLHTYPVFRQTLPEQIDCMRLCPGMASKVTRPHATGHFHWST